MRTTRAARTVFLLARAADGAPRGCGALRPLDDHTAEIKRMYARPGSGAGRVLLATREAPAWGKHVGSAVSVCLGKPLSRGA